AIFHLPSSIFYSPAGESHRLRPILGKVNDGEAAVAEADGTVQAVPFTGSIRTASFHMVKHPPHLRAIDGRFAFIVKNGSDAAHGGAEVRKQRSDVGDQMADGRGRR